MKQREISYEFEGEEYKGTYEKHTDGAGNPFVTVYYDSLPIEQPLPIKKGKSVEVVIATELRWFIRHNH